MTNKHPAHGINHKKNYSEEPKRIYVLKPNQKVEQLQLTLDTDSSHKQQSKIETVR